MGSRPTEHHVDARRAEARLAGFDGLRGLAALGVLVMHTTNVALAQGSRFHGITAQLQSGVQIFFVLSGMLLARPFVRAVLDGRPLPSFRSYSRNRVLRIFPAYVVALLGSVWILKVTYLSGARDWLYHLTLTQVYSEAEMRSLAGIGVAWTLSIEITFYLMLPFFFLAIVRLARRVGALRALVAGTAALAVGGLAFMVWVATTHRFIQSFWLPFYLPAFAFGIALATARERLLDSGRSDRVATLIRRTAVLSWIGAAAILLVVADSFGSRVLMPYREHLLGSQLAYDLYALLVVVPVALDVAGRSAVTRFLALRPVVFLGVVSYPLYLWHYQVLLWVRRDVLSLGQTRGNPMVQLVVVLGVSLVIATASWFGLERPVIEWGRRRRRAPAAVSPPRATPLLVSPATPDGTRDVTDIGLSDGLTPQS